MIFNIATALSLMAASCMSFWQQNLMGGLGYLIATGYFIMYKKEEQKNYENRKSKQDFKEAFEKR